MCITENPVPHEMGLIEGLSRKYARGFGGNAESDGAQA